ncbi:vWA domain-containing protein [Bifidobacterium longum]|uniref:vWA domain-containing protein n=1 Tax=Bifidobacterium longum TaxID=216816 RepID=UPI00256FD3B5|nr:vWA domain-containing protein [Bifidobacterium longum]MDL5507282.1 VWA domain-containing protein [Bifidobacterium longum]
MLALTGCTAFNNSDDGTADGNGTSATTQTFQPSGGKPTATLSIASGSENKEVAVAIQKAADQSNVAVTMHYMGSLEIMNALKAGGQDHDAVWPASSMWISMGDTKHIVKDAASTSTTPIVFGIAKSKAVKLGWADDTGAAKPVSTADILAAVSDGKLTFSMTSATVIDSALNVYQTALRKPSWTIWVVDYSGSMSGEGKNGVVKGLNAALDPDQAKKSYIEPASGGTDIYEGLLSALDELPSESEASQYTTAIVLMTDGRSNSDHQDEFESAYKSRGRDLPIFSIMFGDADPSQLKSLATLSNAKVFDGRSGDLAAVFRQVKGFN